MHFEVLDVGGAGEMRDVSVGDTVFSGARFDTEKLTLEERKWFWAQIDLVATAFGGGADGFRLVARGNAAAPDYALQVRNGEMLQDARALSELSEDSRSSVESRLQSLLEAVNGLLLIS